MAKAFQMKFKEIKNTFQAFDNIGNISIKQFEKMHRK